MKKKFYTYVVLLGLLLGTIFMFNIIGRSASAVDCSPNAVVRCGATTVGTMQANYTGDVALLYQKVGITPAMMQNSAAIKTGALTRAGNVVLDGKVIATGAYSYGRQVIHSTSVAERYGSTTFYRTTNQAAFQTDSLSAFIFTDTNGAFVAAVIKDCGNPADATPTFTPKPGVKITKTIDSVKQKSVGVDQVFTYRILVENTGNVDLVNAIVYDTAPAGVTFLSASLGSIKNNGWSYTHPRLTVGNSGAFTITAKVPTYKAGSIINTACVETKEILGNPDSCDTATVTVTQPAIGLITVCDLTSKTIKTIKETEFNSTQHTTDTAKCTPKPVTPTTVTPVTPTTPTTPVTPVKPVTPVVTPTPTPAKPVTVQIAKTGPAEMIAGGLIGSGAFGVAASSFVRSRRAIADAVYQR